MLSDKKHKLASKHPKYIDSDIRMHIEKGKIKRAQSLLSNENHCKIMSSFIPPLCIDLLLNKKKTVFFIAFLSSPTSEFLQ